MKSVLGHRRARMISIFTGVLGTLAVTLVQAQPEVSLEYQGQFGSQGRSIGSFTSPTGISPWPGRM